MPTNIDTGEIQKWKGVGNFGQGVADFGEKMLKAVGVFAEIKNETQLDEFETDFLSRLHAANMNPDTGFMTRRLGTTADVETLAKEGPQAYKDIFDEVAEAHGMTGVRRNWAMNRVGRTIESANYRLASRVSSAYQQLNLSQAAANVEARHTVWNDGMDDQAATEELLDAGRKLLYAQGYDDSAVELKFGEQVENLAEEYATRRFSELPDEAAVDAELKKLEADPAGILSGNKALADQFSTQHPFSQNVAERLKGRLERRRREIQVRDQQIVDQAANVGIAALCSERFDDVKNADGTVTPGVESSILSLRQLAETMPEGSDARANAARMAADIDEKADVVASRQIENDLIAGKKLTLDDGKTTVFAPGSRKSRLYHAVLEKFNAETSKKDHTTNDRELRYAEAALDYMIESGVYTDDQVAGVKTAIYEKAKALMEGRKISPQDHASFVSRWKSREKEDTSKAAVEFDRAFGVSFDVQPDGDITTAVVNAARKDPHFKPMFPGTDEDVAVDEYFRMRQAFLDNLNALDQKADRVQEARRLIGEFKSGWYAKQSEANIEALSRTMTEIHNAATAEREEQRLREEEEARKKNIPIVSTEHPANRPQEDPLDFYSKAVDPYGITPNYSGYMK